MVIKWLHVSQRLYTFCALELSNQCFITNFNVTEIVIAVDLQLHYVLELHFILTESQYHAA